MTCKELTAKSCARCRGVPGPNLCPYPNDKVSYHKHMAAFSDTFLIVFFFPHRMQRESWSFSYSNYTCPIGPFLLPYLLTKSDTTASTVMLLGNETWEYIVLCLFDTCPKLGG